LEELQTVVATNLPGRWVVSLAAGEIAELENGNRGGIIAKGTRLNVVLD
jgi:hypothetical protein